MAGDVLGAPKQILRPKTQKELELRTLISRYADSTTNVADSDHVRLRQMAMTNGGLLKTEHRKVGWLILTRTNEKDLANNAKPAQEKLRAHKDYAQVAMDVRRALSRFPPGLTDSERLAMTDSLIDAIMRILYKNKELNYYQGFHDVVVTFLIVLGEDWTVAVLEKLCKTHFRDFMRPSIEQTQRYLQLVYVILGEANIDMHDHLVSASVGTMFCLPWLLTWFGHVLHSLDDILRIFDLFVAATPLVPLYLAAAIVLFYQSRILACPAELAEMHHLLTNLTGSADDMHEAPVAVRQLGISTDHNSTPRKAKSRSGKHFGVSRNTSQNVSGEASLGIVHRNIVDRVASRSLPVEEWVQIALDLYVEYPPENLFVMADVDTFVARYLKLERDCAVASFESVPLRRDPLGGVGIHTDVRQAMLHSRAMPPTSASRNAQLARSASLRRLRNYVNNAYLTLTARFDARRMQLSAPSRLIINLTLISFFVALIAVAFAIAFYK